MSVPPSGPAEFSGENQSYVEHTTIQSNLVVTKACVTVALSDLLGNEYGWQNQPSSWPWSSSVMHIIRTAGIRKETDLPTGILI